MKKYQKKPVPVDAFQWKGNPSIMPKWAYEALENDNINHIKQKMELVIRKPHGVASIAIVNDWLVLDEPGHIMVIPQAIFNKMYEVVKMKCTTCKGKGKYKIPRTEHESARIVPCHECGQTGYVT